MLPRDYTKSSNFLERNYAILNALLGSLGAFCAGLCIGWSSNAINILASNTLPLTFENMTPRQVAWVVAVFALGATVSPILVYRTWRFIGSKFFIVSGFGFLVASWVLLAIYQNVITMICARLLAGFAVGSICFILPVYIEDLASPEQRIIIDYIWQSFVAAGILTEFVMVYLGNMQLINILSGIVPAIMLVVFVFMPESPRYMCTKGQTNLAKDTLRKFREIGDETELDVHIWCSKKLEDRSYRNIFKSTSTLRRLLPTFLLVALDQLVGVWVGFLYMSWMFRITGGEYSHEITSIAVSAIFLVSIWSMKFLGISLSDKKTLVVTGVMMAISLIILGFYLHERGSYGHLEDYGYIPLVCYGVFIFLYAIGLCRISWKYMRILTPKRRYFAVRSLCTSLSWMFVVIFATSYPKLIESVGVGWMFWFMALACFLLTILTVVFVPDLESLSTKYILDDDDHLQHDCEEQT